MANNGAALQDSSPYTGKDFVLVGNEDALSITHTSSLHPTLGSRLFNLNNGLHVHSLKKNIFFAFQFTKDNSIVHTIHHFGQFISDFSLVLCCFKGAVKVISILCLCHVRLPSMSSRLPCGTPILVIQLSKFYPNCL